jgi:hypothetical protein
MQTFGQSSRPPYAIHDKAYTSLYQACVRPADAVASTKAPFLAAQVLLAAFSAALREVQQAQPSYLALNMSIRVMAARRPKSTSKSPLITYRASCCTRTLVHGEKLLSHQ